MSVVFDESILDNLSDDPVNAGKEICDHFFSFLQKVRGSRRPLDDYYEDFLKAYSLLGTFQKSVGAEVQEPSLSGDFSTNVEIIVKAFEEARSIFNGRFTENIITKYRTEFERKLSLGFFYTFSDGDVKRIQVLLNQLRELIVTTEELGKEHKERLLRKLEKVQSELHKTMSDLDRFWGLLIEGGVVLQLIGEKAKPILECIEKITRIVWLAQAIATGLPSNAPLQLQQLPGCSLEETDGKDT